MRIPISGKIAAGMLLPTPESDFAYFDSESLIEVSPNLLPPGTKERELFGLEILGTGMIEALIADGDIAILQPTDQVEDGDMVAVWLPRWNETGLVYYYRDDDGYRLQPANSMMKSMRVKKDDTVEVKGVVVLIIRRIPGSVLD